MSNLGELALPTMMSSKAAERELSFFEGPLTAFASVISGYFILAVGSLYWLVAGAGALGAQVLPHSLIQRWPLAWLIASTGLAAALTQTVPSFLPDYSNPREVLLEISLWLSLGLLARVYLLYTKYPDTFDGIKASIASRPLERWLASVLHHPIDAVFARVWVSNSIIMIPLTTLLVLPHTINYFVIAAFSVTLLLSQFPQEILDHTNIHTRVFSPKIGASPRIKALLSTLQFYFEYIFSVLTSRAPGFYRVQHIYVHHVEDNGPLDTQTTLPYDRTSFLDFSRHAFWQGLDLVTGCLVIGYLKKKGKTRQIREVVRGLVIWYAALLAVALFNPVAAIFLFLSRYIGGNFVTLVSFYQHGLVDPDEVHEVHANTIDYAGNEHGNLGEDFHVEHHLKPARHWSHYYEEFARTANTDDGHPAVVMQKDQFGPLALVAALWRKDYPAIARHARLRGVAEGNTQELTRIVRERTRPIGAAKRSGLSARVDAVVTWMMAMALPKSFAG